MNEQENSVPKGTFNAVIVGIVFLVVGVVVGLVASSAFITPAQVETAVKKVLNDTPIIASVDSTVIENAVAKAVAEQLASLPISSAPVASSSSLDEATVQRIVTEAIAQSGRDNTDRFEFVDDDPYLGAEDAPVVIVEFSAYACPYCGRHFIQTLQPLLDNYGQYIRYVYRDFPTINPDVSFPAALAAACANEQGKFWEYHDQLFNNQSQLGTDFFFSVANELELDIASFTTCFEEQRYLDEVNADYFDGSLMNITGTPSFLINGQSISGAQPYNIFERVVLRELEKAGIDPNADS